MFSQTSKPSPLKSEGFLGHGDKDQQQVWRCLGSLSYKNRELVQMDIKPTGFANGFQPLGCKP